MSRALDRAGVVELAILERSGLDESRHLGAAVVVSADGSVLRELGDGSALVYGRSSLKLFQAIAVLRSGVSLEGAQLVLATASHAGTPAHVAVVRSVLERAGLDESALQCPHDWPLDAASRHAADAPLRVTMNCSGKHAAFLLACVHNGWPTDAYLDRDHPLQQLIRSTVEEFIGEPIGQTGVDGCGAPVFATTLRGLAAGVAKACASTDATASRLVKAILGDPWAIDGPGRPNTVVAEQLGLVTKAGAEGVIVMAAPGGPAVALKMVDGSGRATSLVALRLLASVGVISEDEAVRVAGLTTEQILGGGAPVGSIRASDLVTQV